jgi:protein LSM14
MSANAFVGSRISLISKSDVRYVGILHSISTEEATVSLEQGRLQHILFMSKINKQQLTT